MRVLLILSLIGASYCGNLIKKLFERFSESAFAEYVMD